MAERKPLSKKLRFEVFKRDMFTCQYCGAKAPDVTLHVDHIMPVSSGGSNKITNLITACSDCNSGKGARLISDTVEVNRTCLRCEYSTINDEGIWCSEIDWWCAHNEYEAQSSAYYCRFYQRVV